MTQADMLPVHSEGAVGFDDQGDQGYQEGDLKDSKDYRAATQGPSPLASQGRITALGLPPRLPCRVVGRLSGPQSDCSPWHPGTPLHATGGSGKPTAYPGGV